MNYLIHPTALIAPSARLAENVSVGPYAVIESAVEIGEGCTIGPHVHLTGNTLIGKNNHFHSGAVIGDAPQDLKYKGEPTRVRIGDRNTFREHVTVHRSRMPSEETQIGHDGFFMANSHIGHNCILGNHVILANGALLGGHVIVEDRAFISGNCLVHQFTRVGTLALMQGGSAISKDLPPFTIARGDNGMAGLNTIGLRRVGFDAATRLELRRLYHRLFRSGLKLQDAIAQARVEFHGEAALRLIEFIASAKRGICRDTGQGAE